MENGYITFALHSHLPFVRNPEYDRFLEENWLFEAISETYLPLLRVFDRLEADGIPFKMVISLSPTLMAMLSDELLQARYNAHLKRCIELAAKEVDRTKNDSGFQELARMYQKLYLDNENDFNNKYHQNILNGFKHFFKKGNLELITTAATHAFLPFYEQYPKALDVQINQGLNDFSYHFGCMPEGFWLPECGYFPGLEKYLKTYGVKYFFSSSHGILHADQRPKYGGFAPVFCQNDVAVFGRDLASSRAVWSSSDGYPTDPSYRDFYRDIGMDLPMDYIKPYIHVDGIRIHTGFKYYAVTGKTDLKKIYNPQDAAAKIKDHAENFIYNRLKQLKRVSALMDRTPLIVSPFDTELFGHWWFEGPQWIEEVFRQIHGLDGRLKSVFPTDYLKEFPENQKVTPSFSSWGQNGYAEVWLDGSNDWTYRHIHRSIERLQELTERFPAEGGLKGRALNQAAREVLLAMASDWQFIIKTGTSVGYAENRIREHIHNFTQIYDSLCRNTVNTEWLTRIEKKNNVFTSLDYKSFSAGPARI